MLYSFHYDMRQPERDLGKPALASRGVVQVAADLSTAATRWLTAARLAASASFTSAMGPPVRESVIDLNEPANIYWTCRIIADRLQVNRGLNTLRVSTGPNNMAFCFHSYARVPRKSRLFDNGLGSRFSLPSSISS